MSSTAALLCLAAALAADAPGLQDDPTIEKRRSTEAEQGVEGIKGLRATFLVGAPPEHVLATLWDVRRFPEMFPDIEEMEVEHLQEREVRARFTVDAVLAKVSYTLERTLEREARVIRWREAGGDLKAVRGAWKVAPGPAPGTSRVVYESFVDVGRFVPESLYRQLAIGKVNELAGRVRRACGAPTSAPPVRRASAAPD